MSLINTMKLRVTIARQTTVISTTVARKKEPGEAPDTADNTLSTAAGAAAGNTLSTAAGNNLNIAAGAAAGNTLSIAAGAVAVAGAAAVVGTALGAAAVGARTVYARDSRNLSIEEWREQLAERIKDAEESFHYDKG